jgi:hypothetical protein
MCANEVSYYKIMECKSGKIDREKTSRETPCNVTIASKILEEEFQASESGASRYSSRPHNLAHLNLWNYRQFLLGKTSTIS